MGSEERTEPGSSTATSTEPATTTNGAATRPPKTGTTKKTGAKPAAKPAARATTTNPAFRRRAERRPEMIAKRREERMKQFEQRKRQWFYTKIAAGVVGALIAVAVGWTLWGEVQDRIDAGKLDDVLSYEYEGSQHTQTPGEPVTYAENPPVGGTHDGVWQNCGYYASPINNWNAVHSMEHGAVWVTYQPDLPDDQVAKLKEIADTQGFVLVSPYPGLPTPVVVSSWNHQLPLDSANDERLQIYINEYRQNPDTTPEFGASCSGGTTATTA